MSSQTRSLYEEKVRFGLRPTRDGECLYTDLSDASAGLSCNVIIGITDYNRVDVNCQDLIHTSLMDGRIGEGGWSSSSSSSSRRRKRKWIPTHKQPELLQKKIMACKIYCSC